MPHASRIRLQTTDANLDFLIALGFPFELFFPRDPQLDIEERLFEEGKLDTRQACGDYVIGLPEDVRKVRARIHPERAVITIGFREKR